MPQIANGDTGLSARNMINAVLPQAVSFSTTIPLDGRKIMAAQSVASVLAFTPGASPALGAECYVRLTANGTNVPTFSGFVEHGSSAGFLNTAGIVNTVRFWFDGTASWFAITQPLNVVPFVMQTAAVASSSPTQITIDFGVALNTSKVPAASAFTIANSGGTDNVTGVAISGTTVVLTKSRTTLTADALTVTYAAPGSNPVTDTNGNVASSSGPLNVSNGVVPTTNYLRFNSGVNAALVEAGSAGAGWTYTANAAIGYSSTTAKAQADKTLPANQDGWFSYTVPGTTSNGPLFMLMPSATYNNYTDSTHLIYQANANGWFAITSSSGATACDTPSIPGFVAGTTQVRLRRTASSGVVVAEYSNDGSSWTVFHTFTNTTTAKLYSGIMIPDTAASFGIVKPKGSSLVA